MNKIASTLLVSSLVLGGFAVANADNDRYERGDRYEQNERYDKHEYRGKYCNKHGKKSGYRMERMIEQLDLNDAQEKQVHSIRDNYRPKMKALREDMKETRKQLRETMHAETIDQEKVNKLAQTMGQLKTNKIMLRAEMSTEINKVLSKEQREELKNLKKRSGSERDHGYHS